MVRLRKQTWAVIFVKMHEFYALVTFNEGDRKGKFHWNGGPSWSVMGEEDRVEYIYGTATEGDREINQWELHFYQNYNVPKRSDPCVSAGWVSPEGHFYTCEYGEHDGVANYLAAIYHDSLEGTRTLEKKGWVRLESSGDLRVEYDTLNQKQRDTLWDIYRSADKEKDKKFRENLYYWIDYTRREIGNV